MRTFKACFVLPILILIGSTLTDLVSANYSVQRIDAVSLIADTDVYQVVTTEGKLTMKYKSPITKQLTGDEFSMQIFNFDSQRIRWRNSTEEPWCRETAGFSEPLVDWRAWNTTGPQGTLNITASANFNGSCVFSASFLFTNVAVNITDGNVTTELLPFRTKLTLAVYCPWRTAVANARGGEFPGPTGICLGRIVAFQTKLEFKHSTELTGNLLALSLGPLGRIPWHEWSARQCAIDGLPPSHVMIPVQQAQLYRDFIFDFGVYTSLLAWKISFLSYATSDFIRESFVEINFGLFGGNGTQTVSLAGALRFELQDYVEYDPTFDMLFQGDTAIPTPETAPVINFSSNQEASVAAIVAGVIVAVIVIAVVAAFLASPALRRRILPYSARRNPELIQDGASPNEDTESKLSDMNNTPEERPRQGSGWLASRRPTGESQYA